MSASMANPFVPRLTIEQVECVVDVGQRWAVRQGGSPYTVVRVSRRGGEPVDWSVKLQRDGFAAELSAFLLCQEWTRLPEPEGRGS